MGKSAVSDDVRRTLQQWSDRDWADWLTIGFLRTANASNDTDFARAFAPLAISPRKIDPVIQLTQLLKDDLASCAHGFAAGLGRALQFWQPVYGLAVLDELLAFARHVRPVDTARSGSAAQFVDAARVYGRVDVLDAIAAEPQHHIRFRTTSRLVEALTMLPWGHASEHVVEELHARDLWDETYLGLVALARIRTDPTRWLSILDGHYTDLERAFRRQNDIFLLVHEEIVAIIGLRRLATSLLDLAPTVDGVNFDSYRRVMHTMFCGEQAIVAIAREPSQLAFRDETWPTATSDLAPFAKYLNVGNPRAKTVPVHPVPVINKIFETLTHKLSCIVSSPAGVPPPDVQDGLDKLRGKVR